MENVINSNNKVICKWCIFIKHIVNFTNRDLDKILIYYFDYLLSKSKLLFNILAAYISKFLLFVVYFVLLLQIV